MQTPKKTFGGQCGDCTTCGKCDKLLENRVQDMKQDIKEQTPTMEQDTTKLYTFLVYSENVPGLLSQITAVFMRRQVNIESLSVCASSTPGAHKYTVTAYCDERMARILTAQIEKRIEVLQANFYTDEELFINETALFKLSMPMMLKNREISSLVRSYDARIIEVNSTYVVVEITGNTNDIITLFNELKHFDCVLQFVRSGRICITRSRTEHLDEYLAVREAKRIAQQKS